MQTYTCDFLIIGGGIAGLSAAIEASKYGKVILLTKGKPGETATDYAQGGIAAAIDHIKDSTDFHFEDTIKAGAGLCNEKAVKVLVSEGVPRVKELISWGANFDKAETEGGIGFELAMEGAHKQRRILHAGDETGKEIEKTLGRKVKKEKLAEILSQTTGIDLITKDKCCIGAYALKDDQIIKIISGSTIIASGGLCQIYLYTTNPSFATGDGVAMAYRAGAEVTDMEFIQFHPTSLVHSKELEDLVALPRFLISEAVRGEGAKLLNIKGERFMEKYHEQAELAPRDIVSQAIVDEIKKTNSDKVFLSLAGLGAEKIKKRFPIIYKTCLERGLDITKDNIPVAPAAHYSMGGINTDLEAKTNIPGLFAAGECACTGVHGANRLASNSLLEGLVFGRRAAIAAGKQNNEIIDTKKEIQTQETKIKQNEIMGMKMIIKSTMWNQVGIIRSKENLEKALSKLEDLASKLNFIPKNKDELEIKNMATVSKLVAKAALERTESRGGHLRDDFTKRDNKNWNKHLIYCE